MRNEDIPTLVDTVNQHGQKMRNICAYLCTVNRLISDLQGDGDFAVYHSEFCDAYGGVRMVLPKSVLLPAAIAEREDAQVALDELTAKLKPFMPE